MTRSLQVKIKDRWYTIEVEDLDVSPVRVLVDGVQVDVDTTDVSDEDSQRLQDSTNVDLDAEKKSDDVPLPSRGRVFHCPMPGMVISVAVEVGDQVVTGDEICILEAMKMKQVLRAEWTGIVRSVYVQAGQQVLDNEPIVELE